ncbi:MAG: type VII secretion system-associated protein, partial [Saccharopolyspora sp.]|uniref:type VII secretion system-associated protein n=1 Tax=Saccharopolyspora sp. TaxID=33915 RepID=UPI0025D6A187
MNTQQPSRPVITPAMREQASKQPNTWLYVVDPIFSDPSAEVPPWGFIGGYRVDERGELTDDFSPNPNYRPSPVALRLPAPTNDVERALQLTTTGYAQAATLLSALLDAELILFAQPQGSGLFTVDHDSGRRQLQLFTSESFLPANWTSWQRLTGRQLVERNPVGMDLQINPTSAVKARLPAEDLIKTAGVRVAPAAQPEETQPAQVPGGQATGGQQQAPDPISSDFGQRFIGSVLAAAAGDALGAPVEFYPVEQIRNRFGEHGVTDYDRSGSHPGEFTDDTQLAMFTLEGLIRGHIAARGGAGSGPLAAIQLAYQRWLHTQGYAWSRAAGPYAQSHPEPDGLLAGVRELFAVRSPNSDCITALRGFASTGVPGTFERAINDSDDNTGVVRAAPIALWSDEPREVFRLAAAAAALTCSKPSGYLPAGVLAVLVHRLLRGESLTDALAHAHKLLTECTGHQQTERLLLVAEDLAARGEPTPEQVKDLLGDGWSGHEALAIAVCAALSSDGVGPAVMAAVNHSGDSDSTAAICGAIVGAQHGVSAVPGVWLRDLRLRETVQSLAADALVEFGPQPRGDETWSQRYPGERDVIGLEFGSELPRVAGQDAEEPAGQDETAAQDSAPDTAEEQTAEQDAIPVARLSVPGAQPSETGAASAEQRDASPADSGSAESATQQGETADRSSAETDSAQQASPERADPATTPEQATTPAAGPSTADGAAEPQPAAASGTAASDTAASDDAASEDAESAAEPIVPTMGSWPAPSKTAPAREQKPAHDTERAEPGGERILGCLLGTAIGDALGYPVADESIEVIRRNYGGAGVADLVGHAISANTQLSLFTAEGLIRAGIRNRLHGDTDPAQPVQHAYQRWLHTQGVDWADAGGPIADIPPNGWLIREKGLFARRSPDDTCLQALRGYAGGTALGTLTNRLNDAKGSGGVVRAAPAGFRTGDPAETFQTGAAIAALTHGHPSGFLPAGALAVVVSQLLAGRSLPESVDRALTELSTWEGHEETSATLRRAIELATEGTPTPEQIQHRLGAGRVGEQALAIAVCAAL